MSKLYKRKRLTFEEKYAILEEVKSGVSKKAILQKYGCAERTYRKFLSRESDIRSKVIGDKFMKKKTLRTSENVALDAAVLKWFKEARDRGDPVCGPIIKEKALILNEKLNGSKTFQASEGWLDNFKKRNGIRNNRMKGEKLSNDPSVAAEFSKTFQAKIESGNLNLDNIYSADETGILWRLLTACTPALHEEELEASGRKEYKDNVTALFCANATGSHRIPLLTIGKSKNPRCLNNLITKNLKDLRFKNLQSLGVIYTYQRSARMDTNVFTLWYKDEFIPRVLEHQRKSGITGKVVLLLNNAPSSHPSLDQLNVINENFEVVYVPPNMTAFIQPMNQGLIAATKKLYKKNLLRRLLLSEKSDGAVQFFKELDLSDCFGMLSLAWDAVNSSTLQKAWKPLLGDSLLRSFAQQESNIKLEEEDPLSIDDAVVREPELATDLISFPHEICDQVSELLSGPDYSVEKSREFLLEWFENENNDKNDNDCGWESSSDSDMVNFVTNGRLESEIVTKIESSEAMCEDPDMMNFATCGRFEPEIESNETMFEDPNMINFATCGTLEPEIATKIESSETMFENPDIVSLVTNGGCVPTITAEIENSEAVLENPETMETTSSEAFDGLMKLKNWLKSCPECLPKHLEYIKDLENLLTKSTMTNKVHLRLHGFPTK